MPAARVLGDEPADEAHYNLGRLYRDHDKPELSAEHFQTAASLDPRYAEAIRRIQAAGNRTP